MSQVVQKILLSLVEQYPLLSLLILGLSIISGTSLGMSRIADEVITHRKEFNQFKENIKKEVEDIKNKANDNNKAISNIMTALDFKRKEGN